jgi:hypothetical protein
VQPPFHWKGCSDLTRRPTQADSGVTRRFKGGADERSKGKEVVSRVGGGLDTHGRLPLTAPISAPWERGKGCWTVSLSLRGGSGSNDPPARKLADALDTIGTTDSYGQSSTQMAQQWEELSVGVAQL